MEHPRDPPRPAEPGHILMSGHHHPPAKDPLRRVQNLTEHGATVKLSHQLVAAKPLSQPRCHDDTTDRSKRVIQIHQEDILPAAQSL